MTQTSQPSAKRADRPRKRLDRAGMALNQWGNFRIYEMFELIILCVIALAIGYCAMLWLVGRRDDVLHGDFVQTDAPPEFPSKPFLGANAARPEKLQALLTAIQQDLKDATQI